MKKVKISVVIPAYNEEKYIARTLKSLMDQDFPRELFEVIVVNNGSTDKTHQIAEKFGVKVILYTETNMVSAARQAGVNVSQGEILAFTDADTIVPKNWLSKIVEVKGDRNVIALGGKIVPIGAGPFTLRLFHIYDLVIKVHGKFGRHMLWGNNMAVRRTALDAVGGFDQSLSTSEDWELMTRLKRKFGKDGKIVYISSHIAETSNRKQGNPKVFVKYFYQGFVSYINVVILGKAKSGKMMMVR